MKARPVLEELATERHHGDAPGRLATPRVEIFWSPAGVQILESGKPPWRIDETRPARVHLSRARRQLRPGWMQRVMGAPAELTEHSLCAELRRADGRRLALRAVCTDDDRLAGLPPVGQRREDDIAVETELAELLALLQAALAHGGQLVHVAPPTAPSAIAELVPGVHDPRLDTLTRDRDDARRACDRLRDRVAELERDLAARDRSLEWLSIENEKLAADTRAIERRPAAANNDWRHLTTSHGRAHRTMKTLDAHNRALDLATTTTGWTRLGVLCPSCHARGDDIELVGDGVRHLVGLVRARDGRQVLDLEARGPGDVDTPRFWRTTARCLRCGHVGERLDAVTADEPTT